MGPEAAGTQQMTQREVWFLKQQQEGLTQVVDLHMVQKVLDEHRAFTELPRPPRSHSHILPGLAGIWVHGLVPQPDRGQGGIKCPLGLPTAPNGAWHVLVESMSE